MLCTLTLGRLSGQKKGSTGETHPQGSVPMLQLPPGLAGEGGCRKINVCDRLEDTLEVAPLEEGVASRKPCLLLFFTYNN